MDVTVFNQKDESLFIFKGLESESGVVKTIGDYTIRLNVYEVNSMHKAFDLRYFMRWTVTIATEEVGKPFKYFSEEGRINLGHVFPASVEVHPKVEVEDKR